MKVRRGVRLSRVWLSAQLAPSSKKGGAAASASSLNPKDAVPYRWYFRTPMASACPSRAWNRAPKMKNYSKSREPTNAFVSSSIRATRTPSARPTKNGASSIWIASPKPAQLSALPGLSTSVGAKRAAVRELNPSALDR